MWFKFYFCCVIIYFSLVYLDASKLTSIDKLKAESTNRTNCPKKCMCIDSLTGSDFNSRSNSESTNQPSESSQSNQSNQSFIELNSFEVNCTNIESDLESISNSISIKTTHLYLHNNVISKNNLLKLPVLDRLKYLKLTSNTIDFIDDDAFKEAPNINTLKISYNHLNELPKSISKLKKLKNLILQNNQIRTIDKNAFIENVGLEQIDIKENSIKFIDNNVFNNLKNLKKLTLSSINQLGSLPNLTNSKGLEHLTIDRCELRFVPLGLCDWLPNLKSLNLKSNRLTSLPYLTNCTELQMLDLSYNFINSLDSQYFFSNPNKIIYLFFKNNLIKELEENDLDTFRSLQVLDLESNSINKIHPRVFANLTRLRDLNLGKNTFGPSLPTEGLQNIVELKTFGNINLKQFPAPIYFPNVRKLALSYAYHCCEFMRKENEIEKLNTFGSLIDELDFSSKIYEKVTWLQNENHINHNSTNRSNLDNLELKDYFNKDNLFIMKHHVDCIPKPDPFLPCEDLFDFWALRCSVWIIWMIAILGNATVIIVFLFGRTKLDVPRFLVCNLALADFLMGIYLCILALVDSATLTTFRTLAITWQNSVFCSLSGFLAVFSAELSVFILAVITLERNYAITNAMHLNKRLSLRKASIIMIFGYIFAFILAVLPLIGISSYQKFAVCLPFEIDDSWSRIYVLSLVIFNGFAFLILIGCYLRMYYSIRSSQVWFSNDSRIAKRMSLLVFTDFLCWSPIALCTISSVFFNVNLINLSQAKIFTIFILPLNSCCNPFLYAIFTKQFKKDCILLCKKIEESRITKRIDGCKHSSNFDSNRHTPDCTNSIEKHYSDYLYNCRQLPHPNYCHTIGCTNLNSKKQLYSPNEKNLKQPLKDLKGKDDVFENIQDEESLLKFEMTNYFLKNNYNLTLDKTNNGSRLICKCGISTFLPKSRLFFDNCISKDKLANKINLNELKVTTCDHNQTNAVKQAPKLSENEIEFNEEDVFEQQEEKENVKEEVEEEGRSLISKLFNSFIGDKLLGKKEKNQDKNEKCDCQLNENEQQDVLNAEDLFFKQHAERLHQQLIKSKQRLDSISSENFSSRSDSWRQQASAQLKLIEQYFHNKVKNPSLIKYDRKSSYTTGSCSTSTFRISRSSVSSDNFKPLDRYLSAGEKRVLTEDDLRKHLLENKLESTSNNRLIKNQINAEILNNLFKQFLCSDCANKNDHKLILTNQFRTTLNQEARRDSKSTEKKIEKKYLKDFKDLKDSKDSKEFKDSKELKDTNNIKKK